MRTLRIFLRALYYATSWPMVELTREFFDNCVDHAEREEEDRKRRRRDKP